MSAGLRRSIADLACRLLQAALPSSLRTWGQAIRHETAEIPDDTEALVFALDSLFGLMPHAIVRHLLHALTTQIGAETFGGGRLTAVDFCKGAFQRPRMMGVSSAIGATMLGLAYMAAAGAPTRDLVINIGALAIGLTILTFAGRDTRGGQRWFGVIAIAMTGMLLAAAAGAPLRDLVVNACALVIGPAVRIFVGRRVRAGQQWIGAIVMMMAGILLATTLFGETIHGVTRWIRLGRLSLQPSLILLPVMLVAFARSRSTLTTAGMMVAAAALVIQPDRAMAGMLVTGLAILSIMRCDRHAIAALCAGIAGFAGTLARADTLPAAPYVGHILYSSFDVHPLAGASVLAGSAMLVIPSIAGWRHDAKNREAYAVFGTVWLVAIVAAALGNYPTPVVGYGGSAIIGYALCLAALPKLAKTNAKEDSRPLSQAKAGLISRTALRKDRRKNPPFHAAGKSLA